MTFYSHNDFLVPYSRPLDAIISLERRLRLVVSRSKTTYKALLQLMEVGSATGVTAKGSRCWAIPTRFPFRDR